MNFCKTPSLKNITATLRIITIEKPELAFLFKLKFRDKHFFSHVQI